MRRLTLSTTGWLLVLTGLVLYPLPGPGLLVLALGVAVLGRHDPWAARRLAPLSRRAVAGTRHSVATWPRTLATGATTLAVGVSGALWLWDPAQPAWWALPSWTWFPGGTWTGVGQIVSGAVGLAIVVWARRTLVGGGAAQSGRVMNTLSGSGR